VFLWQGRSYKPIADGSVGAMARGSADRYFQQDIKDAQAVPEGMRVRCLQGPVGTYASARGGLRAAMVCGARNLAEFHEKAQFVRITGAGLRESHVTTSPSRARARITPAA